MHGMAVAVECVLEVGTRSPKTLNVTALCDLCGIVDLLIDVRGRALDRAVGEPSPEPETGDEYGEDDDRREE